MSQAVEFVVDGQRGEDGQHGQDGRDGRSGRDGRRGEPAGRASAGEGAGAVDLWLKGPASKGVEAGRCVIQGHVSSVRGKSPWHGEYNLSDIELVIRALGGDGGHGGVGGNGGDGGDGRAGRDATRYSDGEDGEDGGDGGDGGHGSHGTPGGSGGHVTIRCAADETYLLMATPDTLDLPSVVRGGQGGQAGRHGVGGQGGSGGPGGSSYSWYETEYRTERQYDHESGSYENVRVSVQVRYSNDGGWSGSRGSNGWTPNAPLYAGQDGRDGHGEILVEDNGQWVSYAQRYDLVLSDFQLFEDPTEYEDGIFEFGEVVQLRNITVLNCGKMPSPGNHRVHVMMARGQWATPIDSELFIEQSLAPGESIQLEGALRFQIARASIQGPGQPFVASEPVQPALIQLGPERDVHGRAYSAFRWRYHNARLTRELVAQFPVENRQGVLGLRSLAAGERTYLSMDISNVSNQPIGSQSERARRVRVLINCLESDLDVQEYNLFDLEGQPIDLEQIDDVLGEVGYAEDVPLVEAHESAHVKIQFGFAFGIPAYVGVRLGWSMWIEDLHTPGQWVLVQRREVVVRSEPAYHYRPESKIVLVTHNNTSQEAFGAWRQLLEEQLALPFDHWSISRYGHFDHQVELDDQTILKHHLEDKVAVVLNQPFSPRGSEETDLPTDYLRGNDVRDGATTNNTHYMVVGSDRFNMVQLLEPNSDVRRGGDDYPSVDRFLEKEEKTGGPLAQEIFKDDITTHVDHVDISTWTMPFFKPRADAMDGEAIDLQDELVAMHPNRRYLLVKRPLDAPERDGRFWLFFENWKLGTIEVRRTLNTETSSALVLHTEDARLNDPAFILSDEMRYAVLLALPFESKLEQLDRLLKLGELEGDHLATAQQLIRALMTDLSEEQAALARGDWPLYDDVMRLKLSNLERLLNTPIFTDFPADSNRWMMLFELYASLDALCEVRNPWWKFWGRERKMKQYIADVLRQIRANFFDAEGVDVQNNVAMSSDVAMQTISPMIEQWSQRFETRRQEFIQHAGMKVSLAYAAQDCFEHPDGLAQEVTRDIDVWADPRKRIWSLEDFQAAQSREAQRQTKQEQLRKINAKTRQTHLVDTDDVSSAEVILDFEEESVNTEEVLVEVQVARTNS